MKKILPLIVILLLAGSLYYNYRMYTMPVKTETVTEVRYIEKTDTSPVVKKDTVVRYVKVPVPQSKTDSVTVPTDSIELEITQKVYSDDSTYTAYVSGYMPSLDSISVRQKEITNNIINTRILHEKEFRRWSVGITGGYGYGLRTGSLEPFIGLGVTIRLF